MLHYRLHEICLAFTICNKTSDNRFHIHENSTFISSILTEKPRIAKTGNEGWLSCF